MGINRRDFIKFSGAIGISGLPGFVLAKNEGETVVTENLDEIKTEVIENLDEESEKLEEVDKYLAWYMSYVFGTKVIPSFLSGDTDKAVKLSIVNTMLYLGFSSNEGRKSWGEKFYGGMKGVGEIIIALNIADTVQIDYHKEINSYIRNIQKNDGSTGNLLKDSHIQEILSDFNLEVIEKENGEENITSIKNGNIRISREFLEEYVTVLYTNPDEFFYRLNLSISGREPTHNHLKEIFYGNDKISESNDDTLNLIIQKDLEELKTRIRFLTMFIFFTPFLTGVGQANLLKGEIKHLSNSVKEIYISAGFSESTALGFAAQMETRLTSYWFDRFAFHTDIGPIVGAFQKNGLSGVGELMKSMFPIAMTNTKALDIEINQIFGNVIKERNLELNLNSSSKDTFLSVIGLLKSSIQGNFNEKLGKTRIGKIEKSDMSLRFRNNQMWLNNKMQTYIEEENNISSDEDYHTETNKILENLKNLKKGLLPSLGLDLKIGGKKRNVLGIIVYLYLLEKNQLDDLELRDKEEIRFLMDSILNSNKFNFGNIKTALKFQDQDTIIKNGSCFDTQDSIASTQSFNSGLRVTELVGFLDERIKEVDFTKEFFSSHFNNVLDLINEGKDEKEDFGDLNLSIKKTGGKLIGKPKTIANALIKNVKFLLYVNKNLEKNKTLFINGINNLKNNLAISIDNGEYKSVFSIALGLLENEDDSEELIDFYSKYVYSERSKLKSTNSIQEEIKRRDNKKYDSNIIGKTNYNISDPKNKDIGKFNDIDIYRNLEFLIYLQNNQSKTFNNCLEKFKNNIKGIEISTNKFHTITVTNFPNDEISQVISLKKIENFYNEFIIGENENGKISISNLKEIKKDSLVKKVLNCDIQIIKYLFEKTGFNFDETNKDIESQIHKLLHFLEVKMGPNSAEVLIMILLVQSPFIEPLIKTLEGLISDILNGKPDYLKKYIIGFITYIFSMFADNYIGEIVGVDLLTSKEIGLNSGEGMEINDSIGFAGSLAIVGGSADMLGNAPHAIIDTYKKWYGTAFNKGGEDLDYERANSDLSIILSTLTDIFGDVISVGAAATNPLSVAGASGLGYQALKPLFQNILNIALKKGEDGYSKISENISSSIVSKNDK